MPSDTLFLIALQSGLVLGLIHGVNPCGHSWVVLAPFVVGDRDPKRVASLTASFITGTSLGCLGIGFALGLLSTGLPESTRMVADLITAGILLVLGGLLLWKPHLLHSHDHCVPHGLDDDHEDHDHEHDDHDHDHDHDHVHSHAHAHGGLNARTATAWGLGTLGFVNMIVPCPTVAILYSYGLNSASPLKATAVFGVYAVATGAALAGVIFAIYKVAGLMRKLDKPWIEPLIMRLAGLLTVGFGVYSLVQALAES